MKHLWLTLALVACSADPYATTGSARPASITVVGGDAQIADVGDALIHPIQFQVTDARERPVAGITVHFTVTVGDGTVPKPDAITDADGKVQTEWIMGTLAGVQLLQAQVDSSVIGIASAA